jgi:hypothetical protein
MVLVKILKRRDASSVLVAIVLAMIITQPLTSMTGKLASKISGLGGNNGYGYGPGTGWKSEYLFPIVWAAVQIIVLEILAWVYVWASSPVTRVSRKRR